MPPMMEIITAEQLMEYLGELLRPLHLLHKSLSALLSHIIGIKSQAPYLAMTVDEHKSLYVYIFVSPLSADKMHQMLS